MSKARNVSSPIFSPPKINSSARRAKKLPCTDVFSERKKEAESKRKKRVRFQISGEKVGRRVAAPATPVEEKVAAMRKILRVPGTLGRRPVKEPTNVIVALELEHVLFARSKEHMAVTPAECAEMARSGRQRQCRGYWLRFRPQVDRFLRFLFKTPGCDVGVWTHMDFPGGEAEVAEWVRAAFGHFAPRLRFCYTHLDTISFMPTSASSSSSSVPSSPAPFSSSSASAAKKEGEANILTKLFSGSAPIKKDLGYLERELVCPRERILLLDHNSDVLCNAQRHNVYLFPKLEFRASDAAYLPPHASFAWYFPAIHRHCRFLEQMPGLP